MKPFREWLQDLWLENCEEKDSYREPRLTLQEYFRRYRWWLRREYRYQRGVQRGS